MVEEGKFYISRRPERLDSRAEIEQEDEKILPVMTWLKNYFST